MTSATSAAVPLKSQVGGHPGMMTTEDGSLLIKDLHSLELQFYQALTSDESLNSLRTFTPKFYGTLRLEGKLDTSQPNEGGMVIKPLDDSMKIEAKESLVLENLCYSFLKPNILDVKHGTILYDEVAATPEKRSKMEQKARETTSLETGIRFTGFQVYDNITDEPLITPRAYGRSLRPSELSQCLTRFFPVAPSDAPCRPDPIANCGLPRPTLLSILRALREETADLREVLSKLHVRMRGVSALIIYEADWARSQQGVDALNHRRHIEGEADRIEGTDVDDEDEGEEEEEDDEEEDDDDDDESELLGPPFVLKLIDFAHTRITPGQGPDEGILFGLDNLIRLLDERIEEIRSTTH